MGFNSKQFLSENFEPREKAVPVPELKDFFDEGEKPVWIVRGLTGKEIGLADQVAARRSVSASVLEGLLSKRNDEIIEAIKNLVGRAEDMPEAIIKRLEHLQMGSVDPVCDLDLALKVNKVSPTVFLNLTNEILILTGLGMTPGKSKPFGKIKASKSL